MFITSYYEITPANPKATSQPGFWSDPSNLYADEIVNITRKLNDSDLKRANLILDLRNKEVIKCRNYQLEGEVVTEPSYESLLESIRNSYPNQVDMAVKIVEGE